MIVVQKDFKQQVGASLMIFTAGKVIEDEVLEGVLLLSHAPVSEVQKREDLITCPHCRKMFTIQQAVGAEIKTS